MASTVRFWFRGQVVCLDDVRPTMSVLEWLRLTGASRGTKEGCNQGDCGACTVMVAELGEPAGRPADGLRVTTANSCLLLVPLLDGKALFTVEDAGTPEAMHPVQQALVDCGGSQCGFCTPGFVMSLWARTEVALREGEPATRASLCDAITGNLCRCTGYRPIVDAAVSAAAISASEGSPAVDWPGVEAALRALASRDPQSGAPATEAELAATLADRPHAHIVAGGTDLVVAMRATGAILDDDCDLVPIGQVASLRRIDEASDQVVLGAAVPLEDAWAVLVRHAPGLDRMRRRFASPAIRATGTIGGNLANSSPIADLVPVLIALDAQAELVSVRGSRTIAVAEFATGVRANALEPGEFLARISVPCAAFERDLRAHKVSRRFDDDISSVSAVLGLALDDGRVADIRAVFGGLAVTVRRASAVEAAVLGEEWSEATMRAAQAALEQDFTPIDDHRASGWYRLRAAQGLLERWWLETSAEAPAAEHDVWASR